MTHPRSFEDRPTGDRSTDYRPDSASSASVGAAGEAADRRRESATPPVGGGDRRGPERRGLDRRFADRRATSRRGRPGTDVDAGTEQGAEQGTARGAANWHLVTAAQEGDGAAFGMLYDQYFDQVFGFILVRVSDRSLAEDLTSDTFVRALRNISSISYQGRDIGAWFMTIARNIVLDHAKSAHSRHEIATADDLDVDATHDSAELTVLGQLTTSRLLGAVRELSDEQRDCIVLRFIQGLSLAETARQMGKNEGSVKALQHRAVKRLASAVSDELK